MPSEEGVANEFQASDEALAPGCNALRPAQSFPPIGLNISAGLFYLKTSSLHPNQGSIICSLGFCDGNHSKNHEAKIFCDVLQHPLFPTGPFTECREKFAKTVGFSVTLAENVPSGLCNPFCAAEPLDLRFGHTALQEAVVGYEGVEVL